MKHSHKAETQKNIRKFNFISYVCPVRIVVRMFAGHDVGSGFKSRIDVDVIPHYDVPVRINDVQPLGAPSQTDNKLCDSPGQYGELQYRANGKI